MFRLLKGGNDKRGEARISIVHVVRVNQLRVGHIIDKVSSRRRRRRKSAGLLLVQRNVSEFLRLSRLIGSDDLLSPLLELGRINGRSRVLKHLEREKIEPGNPDLPTVLKATRVLGAKDGVVRATGKSGVRIVPHEPPKVGAEIDITGDPIQRINRSETLECHSHSITFAVTVDNFRNNRKEADRVPVSIRITFSRRDLGREPATILRVNLVDVILIKVLWNNLTSRELKHARLTIPRASTYSAEIVHDGVHGGLRLGGIHGSRRGHWTQTNLKLNSVEREVPEHGIKEIVGFVQLIEARVESASRNGHSGVRGQRLTGNRQVIASHEPQTVLLGIVDTEGKLIRVRRASKASVGRHTNGRITRRGNAGHGNIVDTAKKRQGDTSMGVVRVSDSGTEVKSGLADAEGTKFLLLQPRCVRPMMLATVASVM